MLDATERAALAVLGRRLGWLGALRVGVAVERARRRGEPFADLPPAGDAKEAGSRAQAGPAILLYRALRDRVSADDARAITGEAVSAGALVFLRASLGPLRRAALAALDDAGRRAFAADRADRFPNATLTWDEVSADRVAFTVHACRLVTLVAHAGHPELAPLFCAGDAAYFGAVEPGVVLDRPETLAGGGAACRFSLRFAPEAP